MREPTPIDALDRAIIDGLQGGFPICQRPYAQVAAGLGMSIDELGRQVGALAFVTHCYHRPRQLPDWPYNLFAMVHGGSRAEVMAKVAEIAGIIGSDCRAHDVLFSTRILKKTGLRIGA